MSDTNFPSTQPADPPSPTFKPRSLFWLAFVVTFVLWTVASCGGGAALIGFDDFSLADFQSSGPVWTPPPVSTAPAGVAEASSPEANPTTPVGRFQPGGRAENATSSRVNIRRSPGYLGKPSEDILAQMAPAQAVEILGWSRTSDNLIWWPVRYQASDGAIVEGWVAESTESGVQILRALP